MVTQSPLGLMNKADTLRSLYGNLRTAEILPILSFTVGDWQSEKRMVVDKILGPDLPLGPVIIRSSAESEDTAHSSMAGSYLSLKADRERKIIEDAVTAVIDAYGKHQSDARFFVQPYLTDVIACGVAFNRDQSTGTQYDIIEYSEGSSTDTVTSGNGQNLNIFVLTRWHRNSPNSFVSRICLLLRELESLYGDIPLDIEFAFDSSKLYLFQARHLVLAKRNTSASLHYQILTDIRECFFRLNQKHPTLLGRETVLGIMPDWNPAEMIGVYPRPLAMSLYRKLITDSIWSGNRFKYGYRDVRQIPLMVSLHGLPYIDVRASVNSLIPRSIPDEVATKIVDACIDRLRAEPHLHDKIEFELVPSCYSFLTRKKLVGLGCLSEEEIAATELHLKEFTKEVVCGKWSKNIDRDIHDVAELSRRLKDVVVDPILRFHTLLRDCQRFGTSAFVGLARMGFIAMEFIRSAADANVITDHEVGAFLASTPTPASRLARDITEMSQEEILKEYGHLRPGTYDIRVPSYREAPERYFNFEDRRIPETIDHSNGLGDGLASSIGKKIADYLGCTPQEIEEFLVKSIVNREEAKFVFSQAVSMILDCVAEIGAKVQFSREELSFTNVDDFMDLGIESWSISETLRSSISDGQNKYEVTQRILLPSLITTEEQVFGFQRQTSIPSFITKGVAQGRVACEGAEAIDGTILFIKSADPGYDWIFSRKIKGFVTAYGGANSHMAIRASELGIPAAIGAGELLFERWSKASQVRIDCGSQKVEVIE